MLAAAVDWTPVLVAFIAAVPGTLGVVFAYLIHRDQKTPSGEPIGKVVEYTFDLAATNSALLQQQQRAIAKLNQPKRATD